ncbi:MAG: TonB-dependent receptor [Pseudomonadota bacterium]
MRRALLLALAVPAVAQAATDEPMMEEIIVVGSQIRGAQISEALPVSVFDRNAIEALGIISGDELLENLSEQGQNLFNEAENISGGVNSARGDIGAFNLRNIGTGNTLVLLNGRRVVNAASYQTELVGGSFVPVNTANAQSIPVAGLERLEVLRDGASAIYGADAVAGVVNYVLKDDLDGASLRVRWDTFEHLPRDDLRLTLEAGRMFNDERTRVGVFVNYYDRDRVNSQDDARWADSDFRPRLPDDSPWQAVTSFRNNSVNSEFGQFDIRGADFAGLTDSSGEFETFPSGDSRCEFDIHSGTCGAVDGNGTVRGNLNANRDLFSKLQRTNVFAYFNHDFENGMESFTEASAYISRTNLNRHGSARLSAVAKHRIAPDYYWNPFGPTGSPNRIAEADAAGVPAEGVELEVDNYRVVAPRVVDNDGETYRFLTGLRGTWNDWDWEGAFTWSRAEKTDITRNRVSNTLFDAALADPTASAFNIFGGATPENLDSILVDVRRENEAELLMFDVRLSNANIGELPGGPVGLVVGAEYREEKFDDDRDPRLDGTIVYTDVSGNSFPFISDVMNSSPTADSSGKRDVTSLYAELQIPVIDGLDVQLALRYEDFSDVGDTTVGKAAFGYRPFQQLLIRGSWSEAFRAPNLVSINEAQVARTNTLTDFAYDFVDPNEDVLDTRYGMQRTAQGSATLQPEQSDNWNVGVVIEPLDSVTVTFDFWEIEKTNTIGLFGESNHLALELFNLLQAGTANCGSVVGNPAVVRGAPDPANDALFLAAGICPLGEVQRIDDQYANLDTRTVRGFDLGLYFDVASDLGDFVFSLNGSFLDKFEQEAGGESLLLVEASASGALPANVTPTGFANLIRQNGNAKNKFTARASWRKDNWGAFISGIRYDDFIQTSLTLADGTEYVIPSMATFNAAVTYSFQVPGERAARVRLGVNNFTDERAPLADRFFGYYADQHNDLGRSFYLDFQIDLF